ncbi:hypothetical protein LTR36_006964 [Oleoguttula mirabilis]|uniref:Uncharacterized protein n=1 Tax=Oleoguttula mirabilis TaxID=1507867 RepID=A0AAV9JBL5_9PEZI|nr:hypothetical protein LTR36_006964 [Oleoguttula mirabilis]
MKNWENWGPDSSVSARIVIDEFSSFRDWMKRQADARDERMKKFVKKEIQEVKKAIKASEECLVSKVISGAAITT